MNVSGTCRKLIVLDEASRVSRVSRYSPSQVSISHHHQRLGEPPSLNEPGILQGSHNVCRVAATAGRGPKFFVVWARVEFCCLGEIAGLKGLVDGFKHQLLISFF